MALSPGMRLGPYEMSVKIGEGGMGEVYRATDTNLKRQVAIKVLPAALASDTERLARFQREAEVLASLNHPNIAIVHGLEKAAGVTGLVKELVEGPTLADLVGGAGAGPRALPIEDALPIAKQIAEALEAAHEQGIIHRDLKPANIKVKADGVVKVLDFGLAKAMESTGAMSPSVSQAPTITTPAMMTGVGVILGTAAYMSPEQASGKPVDKRADIWSFGVVLWEMLIGRRLFDGETISHTLADVLRSEIDFDRLPPEVPSELRTMLRRCLTRDVKNRLRDVGEVRVSIQDALARPAKARDDGSAAPVPVRRSRTTQIASGAAAVAIALATGLALVHFGEQPPAADVVRFQVQPPPGTAFLNGGVLSPDGRRIAFDAPGPDGRSMLWVRALESLDARALPGTEGASPGTWSPDSRFLAFAVQGVPARLKKVDVSGGPPQTLAEFTGIFRGSAWSPAGVILFGVQQTGLFRVSDSGGTAAPVTSVDPSRGENEHAGGSFLADGRAFLYYRASRSANNRGIYLGSLDAAPNAQSLDRVIASDSQPVFARSAESTAGEILFLRESTLLAQGFDGRSRVTTDAVPIAEDVGNRLMHGWFSVSSTGALSYRTGQAALAGTDLLWFDRQGRRVGQVGPRASYNAAQLSPDGRTVLTGRPEEGGTHVWTAEVSRGIFGRLYSGEGSELAPTISPGGRVIFSSTQGGAVDLSWMPAGGSGAPEPLLKSATVKHANDVSPDGRFLIYDDHTSQRQDLWVLPLDAPAGGGERKPIPFLATTADETFGQFSPDGRWVAYSSDESGRREVYVQGFAPDRAPAAAVGKWTISTAGGDKPRWSHDGRELFYIAPDGKLMAVPVRTGATFEPSLAVELFQTRAIGFFPYDVSPDGWFLINTPGEVEAPASSPVTIVLNWRQGLRR